MFARKVAAPQKPNSVEEFTQIIECEVLPWLRTQEGFLDLITLAIPENREVATISFWDHRGSAQDYNAHGHPKVLKLLGNVLDGTPYVKTFDVVSSTFQRVVPAQPIETSNLIQGGWFS